MRGAEGEAGGGAQADAKQDELLEAEVRQHHRLRPDLPGHLPGQRVDRLG